MVKSNNLHHFVDIFCDFDHKFAQSVVPSIATQVSHSTVRTRRTRQSNSIAFHSPNTPHR